MTNTKLLSILLISIVLLFGCTSSNVQDKSQVEKVPAKENVSPASNQTEAQGIVKEEQMENNSDNETKPSPASETPVFNDKKYEQLLALGIPIQCDITTVTKGQSYKIKIYMNGESEIRSEIPYSSESCSKTVAIIKGKKSYIGCEGQMIVPKCNWLEFDINDSKPETNESSQTGTYTAEDYAEDYKDVPTSDIKCQAWVYDASKFTTPGKICNLEDMMNNYGDYGYG